MKKLLPCLALLVLLAPNLQAADTARFDLSGPKIEVKVTRGDTVLPISQVPNLQPGDKIWLHPDLPPTQSAHLLLVAVFLRGTTNPPPDIWFTRLETWDKKTRAEGVTITVPEEAQQALLFVAPETGGDFSTLKSAVKGRPGIFIRASADLNEASFEQARIERYLDAMRTVPQDDQKAIAEHSQKLAATLNLKPNPDCFKLPVDQQVTCLRQSGSQTLLEDGHGQTVAAMLSNGTSSDFINAAAATPLGGAGVYSAYVGAIVDAVRLMSGLHTAQYQYIPAIQFPQNQTLNLRLNAPPSFLNPKSVIVIGLPAIQKAVPPPLRPHDAHQVACLLQPKMILPLEGAPLVFSTGFAHDLVLRLKEGGNLPLKPDAFEGGLEVDRNASARKPLHDAGDAKPAETSSAPKGLTTEGTVHGFWGFDAFEGPTIAIQQLPGKDWKIVGNNQLTAGQDNQLVLSGTATACIDRIQITTEKGRPVDVDFKPAPAPPNSDTPPANTLELHVALKNISPGGYSLHIRQFGSTTEDKLDLKGYTGAIHLEKLAMHPGDRTAVLTGAELGDVEMVEIEGVTFKPEKSASGPSLQLTAEKGVSPADQATAQAKLRDGRTMPVKITLQSARPGLTLLSKTSTPEAADKTMPITLGDEKAIHVTAPMTFVVQSDKAFPRTQKIEVSTVDGSVKTMLSLADASLVLQDEKTAIATITPLKAFGPSAFGPLQMRPVADDGTTGEWMPLGILVRTPALTNITCTATDCTLTGSNLFLLSSVGTTADAASAKPVPTGYAAGSLTVPVTGDHSKLYLTLRDDPATPATVAVPGAEPPPVPVPAAAPAPDPATNIAPAAPATTPTPTPEPTPPASAPTSTPVPKS
ncbi:hypothetical protein [Terriglobus saanensis]|uniref:Uncharacterized protein n=1 Tax=Terriglobus saanensis (strain ATCC BAA-1853 / DSM 23119 / SP1PR4) TaxID=401053 RepID=E8V7C5_TERSS|nr:hypothetical protein [Terriglobus saanensis]ADV82838.1 hypothetical protein AciPR4_2034 [Terriglobus saanensis SP1PR4]